jgi:hypothetical protein
MSGAKLRDLRGYESETGMNPQVADEVRLIDGYDSRA